MFATGCASSKPILQTVPVEVVKYERIPIPQALLRKYCETDNFDAVVTNADLELLAARLYACNARHNEDKAKIGGL